MATTKTETTDGPTASIATAVWDYNMATKTAKCPCHLFMIDEGSKDGERAFIVL